MATTRRTAKPKPSKASAAKSSKTTKVTKPHPKVVTKAKAPPAKPAPKVAPKAAAAKPGSKPAAPAKPAAKAPVAAKPAAKSEAKPVAAATAAKAPAPAAKDAKAGPKGITIVTPKPLKKPKVKKLEMPVEPLLKPGMKWKPLIASGPKAPPSTGIPGVLAPVEYKIDPKAKLPKKELDRYKQILLEKRAELIGDISNIEDEALRQSSGSLSTLPQHMAEQGSDNFEQSLSLDLAQVDRHLLREIDAALKRIDAGTYGICERTGKRISVERLAELPWARYSIEAAREMERRPAGEKPESETEDDSL